MENSPNSMVESRQEFMVPINNSPDAKPVLRTAHFLTLSLTSNHQCISDFSLPSLPPDFDPKNWPLTVNFHGWRNPTKIWKEWVEKMAFHAPTWEKAGILDAILNSTYEIHKNTDLVLGFAERWCPDNKSFIFPWGEATVTLEDMLIAGYSVLGSPVFEPLETEESKAIEEVLIRERRKINKTQAKKPHYAWLKIFMDSGSEIEHEAFLSLWLSRFVLPTSRDVICECVFPIAIHLARGTRIALAPAVLSTIYRDLSLLKQKIVSLTTLDADEKVVVTTFAPFQLVLVWLWERFMKLSPKSNLLKKGEPRLAQWNNVKCNIQNVRSFLDSSKESSNWRPYTKPLENWDFPKFYSENEMWVLSDSDSDLDDDSLSFIMCLRVSELVGVESECIQQYLPHRVARQFGFDQDIPGFVVQSSGSSKDAAWSNYIRPVGDVECFIPSRFSEKDVTTRYLDWWNTLEFHQHSNLATDVLKYKKKAEASLSSGDKRAEGDSIASETSNIKIEKIHNLSVPPGFLPKCVRVEVGDSSDLDNLTISQILKSKQNQDVTSDRQCANGNNLSGIPKRHSSPSGTKISAKRILKSNDDGNLTPSQSRSHSCSGAVNGILRGPDQVALVEEAENKVDVDPVNVHVESGECQTRSSSVSGNDQTPNDSAVKETTMVENVTVKAAEDVDPENVHAEFGECQSHLSSVARNDQTRNDSEVKEATVIAQNVTVNAKQDVESANNCAVRSLADNETNNINEYSVEAALMGMEYRIERLEKKIGERKALLRQPYSGRKRARD